MANPSHVTSGVRSRRAHHDLRCNLILGIAKTALSRF